MVGDQDGLLDTQASHGVGLVLNIGQSAAVHPGRTKKRAVCLPGVTIRLAR